MNIRCFKRLIAIQLHFCTFHYVQVYSITFEIFLNLILESQRLAFTQLFDKSARSTVKN